MDRMLRALPATAQVRLHALGVHWGCKSLFPVLPSWLHGPAVTSFCSRRICLAPAHSAGNGTQHPALHPLAPAQVARQEGEYLARIFSRGELRLAKEEMQAAGTAASAAGEDGAAPSPAGPLAVELDPKVEPFQ